MSSSKKSSKTVVVVDDRSYRQPSVKSVHSKSSYGTYATMGSGADSSSSRDSSWDRVERLEYRSSKADGYKSVATSRKSRHGDTVEVHNDKARGYDENEPSPPYTVPKVKKSHK